MFRRSIYFLLLCCFVFFTRPLLAQEYTFKNYTVDGGLPSPEVYCSLQDNKGYMWFGTDRGVCRFNGYNFETFTISDGLAYNTVYGLYQDYKNRIWFLSNSNQLCYYENNKIIQPAVNKQLKAQFPNSVFKAIYCDKGDTIWLSVRSYGLVKITPDNKIVNVFPRDKLVIKTFDDKNFISSGAGNANVSINTPSGTTYLQLNAKNSSYAEPFVFLRSSKDFFLAHGPFNHDFTSFTDKKINTNKTFDYQILCAIQPSQEEFWFGSRSMGVFCYANNDFSKPTRRFLKHASISSVLKDREGNFWFTTLEDGVYLLRTLHVLSFPEIDDADNNKYTSIFADKKNIWIGTDKGFTYKLDEKNAFYRYPQLSTAVLSFIRKNDDEIWLGSNSGNYIITGQKLSYIPPKNNISASRLFKGPSGTIWGATANRLYKYANNAWVLCNKNPKDVSNGYIDAISEDKNGMVWLGCNDGLWQFNSNNNSFRKIKEIKVRIKDIKIPEDQSIWMASQGAGAILFKNNKFTYFNKKNGLLSNLCNSIYIDDEENAWISTYRGLNCIKEKDKKHIISNITTVDGLISNEVLDCCKFNDNLWVFTGNGISYLNLRKLKPDTLMPRIYFTDVKVNAEKKALKNSYSLSYKENNISINYIGLYFKNAGNINYRYKLDGVDTSWTYTDNTNVQYGVLRPGNYKFLVEAQNNAGAWSKNPESISIIIHPPFWSTTWFLFLISTLFLGGAYMVFNIRLKQIVKRENLNNELIRYKNNALQARMNPHFIFNSLNSINNYILQNDKQNSSRYLSKFASLMRFILDNSIKTNISLEAEIHGLQLYLDLEKQRFKEKLNYEINIDPQINITSTRVPALILQPFVENAILHGILPKKEPGLIKINISKNQGYILCVIEDNGVGRTKNMDETKEKSPGHVSNGIQVTKERLQLLNRLHKERTELNIIDLTDKDGKPAGTRVELIWPVIKD